MRRLLAVLSATLLMLPGPAAAEVTNDEVALVTLDPSGLPTKATLVSRITSTDGPTRSIDDPSSTTNVSYRDRPGAPETTSDGVRVEIGAGSTVLTEALFDRPLPVALHARYALAGRVVDPSQVLGSTGDITITYTATNTTAEQQRITYVDAGGVSRSTDLPVFAPFAGTLVVTVPRGMTVVAAPGAVSSTDPDGATVLRFDLLLAPPAGSFTAEAVVQLRAEEGASTPGVVMNVVPVTGRVNPALGFAEGLLNVSGAASQQLADGLAGLDDGVVQLADGALALAAGAAQLQAGQQALTDALDAGAQGAASAVTGSRALSDGLAQLSAGLQGLSGPSVLPAAAGAAGRLSDGARVLTGIVGSADDGPWQPQVLLPARGWPPGVPPWPPTQDSLPQWADAVSALPVVLQGLGFAPDGHPRDNVCNLDADGDGLLDDPVTDIDCVPTIVQSLRMLASAAGAAGEVAAQIPVLLAAAGTDLTAAGGSAAQAAAGADSAAGGADALLAELCGATPQLDAAGCEALAAVQRDAAAARAAARSAGDSIAAAAPDLAEAGVRSAGLAVGLPLLAVLLQGVTALAEQVGAGLETGLQPGLTQLQQALAAAAAASGQLAEGAGAASTGAQQLADGASQLADGLGQAAAGSGALAEGAAQLGSGVDLLAGGAEQLRADGTAPALAAVINGSADAALASAYLAAVDARAADALPYGAPEGAVGNAAYVLDMPATYPSNDLAAWALAALGVLVAAGFAVALVRRGQRTGSGGGESI